MGAVSACEANGIEASTCSVRPFLSDSRLGLLVGEALRESGTWLAQIETVCFRFQSEAQFDKSWMHDTAATVSGLFWGYHYLSASNEAKKRPKTRYRHLVLDFPWVPSEAFRKAYLYPLFWNRLLSMIDLVCHCVSVD